MASMTKKAKAKAEAKSGKVFQCGFCYTPCDDTQTLSQAEVVCGQVSKKDKKDNKFCSEPCARAWVRQDNFSDFTEDILKHEAALPGAIQAMRDSIEGLKEVRNSLASLDRDFAVDGFPNNVSVISIIAKLTKSNGDVPSPKEVKKVILGNLTHNLAILEIRVQLAREYRAVIKYRKALLSRQPRAVLQVLQKQLLDAFGDALENHMITQNESATYYYSTRITIEQGDIMIDAFCCDY